MKMLKTIRLFYLFYSIYTILVMLVSDYAFFDAFFGILSIWIVYLVFSMGFQRAAIITRRLPQPNSVKFFFSNIANWKSTKYVFSLDACVACSVLATKYYTGKNFIQVITSLTSTSSNYNEYQQYFRNMNISVFSLAKIPYILMLTFLTAMLFWGIIGITLSGKKIRFVQWIFLAGVCVSYLYFGIARGTNFEMYIVFVLVVFCLLNRTSVQDKDRASNRINKKAIIIVLIIGVAFVLIFRIVVQARGIEYRNIICTEITYDSDKIFSEMFPTLTNILLSVFSYLGFGIFAIGRSFMNMLDSVLEVFASLLPGGFQLFFGASFSDIVRERINVGVRWIPDYIRFVNLFGVPIFLLFVFALGKYMAKKCCYSENNLLSNLLGFIIFMEMLSIPVGNFILNSTANELVIVGILLWEIKTTVSGGQRR